MEKLPIEQLYSDDSKDEMKKYVHDENIEHILEGVDHTVEHGLQLRHSLDGLQWTQHSQDSQRLDHA